MIIAPIPIVIELGINLIHTDLNIPETILIKNSSGTFEYQNNTFYSTGNAIAFKHAIKVDSDPDLWLEKISIYGKTAKFGDYFSDTCSKHINMLIRYCKNHTYFKDNYSVLNQHGNVIKKKRNTGVKYYGLEKFECAICLDTFYRGKKLGCNHIFCKVCISKWLKVSDECPYCKTSIYTGDNV